MATASVHSPTSRAVLLPHAVCTGAMMADLALAGVCQAQQTEAPETALRGMYVAFLVWELLILWSWHQVTGRVFDAYTLPATALWLFNGGGGALARLFEPDPYAVFHALRLPVLRDFTDVGVLQAFHLTLYCLAALHLGALLAVSGGPRAVPPPGFVVPPSGGGGGNRLKAELRTQAVKDPYLAWMGLALIGVSFVPALLMLRDSLARVAAGGYMALYQPEATAGEADPWYYLLASGLVVGAFLLAGSDLDNRRLRWTAWAIILPFSTGLLALGTRASFYQNMIGLLWLHHYGVRPIRKVVWAALVAAGVVLSVLIYWAREDAGKTAMSWEGLRQVGLSVPRNVTEPFAEMGTSIMTVVYVLDLVPAERDYGRGESYVHALLAGLPRFVAGDYFADRETEEIWLVQTVSPLTARISGGLGFSLMAEAYLNFGVGAPVVLGLMGVALGAFAGWAHAPGRSGRLALAACVISIVLFSARASSLSFVRRVLWLCVFPFLAAWFLELLESRMAKGQRRAS